MSIKKEHNYFQMFVESVTYTCQAADLLHENFKDFNTDKLRERIKAMHEIEHTADLSKHTMMEYLHKEFITPIDREDIMELANTIDDVTDSVEDVILRLYMFHITSLREDALAFTELIAQCCQALKNMLEEFPKFHKSKILRDKVIEINRLEESGDALYMEAMHRLYTENADPVTTYAWTALYDRMEKCCDRCENVAEVIERVILKNS